jgi:hypothetical protein
MANEIDLSKIPVALLAQALFARKDEVAKDTSALSTLKSTTKGVSSPREKSNQALRALLGNAVKEVRSAFDSAVKVDSAVAVKFLVDKWGDDTSIEIEITSIAGEAPAGKQFQSVASNKFYPSRHSYLRTEVKDHVRSSYAKGQVGDNVLKMVDLPAAKVNGKQNGKTK